MKLSTFGLHLIDAAAAQGISVAEMARRAHGWGVTGVDLWVGQDERHASDFLDAGMTPSAVIAFADLAHRSGIETADGAIAYAKRTGCGRIMLVPGYLADGEMRDGVWPTVMGNLAEFVEYAKRAGMDTVIEDFDHEKALIGSAEHLRRTFASNPDVGLVLDTGNFDGWGDDVLAATDEFLPRIRHVHLKDRDREKPGKSVPTGAGFEPIREICRRLLASGYGGWFTIECFGADDMYAAIEQSACFLRHASRDDANNS